MWYWQENRVNYTHGVSTRNCKYTDPTIFLHLKNDFFVLLIRNSTSTCSFYVCSHPSPFLAEKLAHLVRQTSLTPCLVKRPTRWSLISNWPKNNCAKMDIHVLVRKRAWPPFSNRRRNRRTTKTIDIAGDVARCINWIITMKFVLINAIITRRVRDFEEVGIKEINSTMKKQKLSLDMNM